MLLIFRTSKISFCLLFFFVLPLYINADFVLQIWLASVPEFSVAFTRLILFHSLIDAFAGPLWVSIHATGDIKKYQLVGSCIVFLNLPLVLLFLWMGFNPAWVLIIRVMSNILLFGWRIVCLAVKVSFPIAGYLRKVILPTLLMAGVSSAITAFAHGALASGWPGLLISCAVSTVCIACLIYFVVLNGEEKKWLLHWLMTKMGRAQQVIQR